MKNRQMRKLSRLLRVARKRLSEESMKNLNEYIYFAGVDRNWHWPDLAPLLIPIVERAIETGTFDED